MKLRNKTTATLLTAIFMISIFAVVMPVSAKAYFYDEEVVWVSGAPIVELPDGDSLAVEVWYKGSKAYFRATIPECYEPETSYATFAFDVDNDDLADFQIQYDETCAWVYSEVEGTFWVKDISDWQPVPSEYIPKHITGSRVFELKLPMSVLSSTYRFGFQAGRRVDYGGATNKLAQIFCSTTPGELWYDALEKDYVHSTYYVEMHLPPLKSDSVPGKGNGLDKPIPNDNFAKGRQK